jgi:hypothetical protein
VKTFSGVVIAIVALALGLDVWFGGSWAGLAAVNAFVIGVRYGQWAHQ